jgi:hypothetical protein
MVTDFIHFEIFPFVAYQKPPFIYCFCWSLKSQNKEWCFDAYVEDVLIQNLSTTHCLKVFQKIIIFLIA